jgi:glycosyltransferase involved in cell wall biosynthesis
MGSSPVVQFINAYPPPTAIWRYARMMRLAAGSNAHLATVCIGGLDFSGVDRSTSTLHGDWPLSPLLRSALNTAFPKIALRALTARCQSVIESHGVLHYLSEELRPWIKGDRLIVTIHGNPMATLESEAFYSFHAGYKMLVRGNLRTYGRLATCVAQSEYVRRGLEEFGYDGPIHVIPPAVDPLFRVIEDRLTIRRSLNLPLDRKILLSISSAEHRKNLGVIPQVLDLLPPEYLLVRVGPPVRGAMTFHDLSDEQVARLYSASDALLFPTLEEGFGLPVIEAFAAGLPVVASAIPVIEEVSGGKAVLVDPQDPKALARACQTAISERDTLSREGLGRAGDFTLEKLAYRLQDFYRLLPS